MKLNLKNLSNKQIALIAVAVGAVFFFILRYLYTPTVSTKHLTTMVNTTAKEVKTLEQKVQQIRKETDENIPQVQSLDIDPLVDFFNDWLRRREENRSEHRNDY